MRTPQRISPGARARRALLLDTLAALLLALVLFQLAAGLGVVAAIAVPTLLVGLAWIGLERLVVRSRLRRRKQARA